MEKETRVRGFRVSARIRVLVKENPGVKGSKRAKWFALYAKAKTVGRYVELARDPEAAGYLPYDVARKYIAIER